MTVQVCAMNIPKMKGRTTLGSGLSTKGRLHFGVAFFHFHHSIPHDPGAPPHRPHVGASDADDDFPAPSAPTAKTLSARAVFADPHSGQTALWSPDMVRTS
jgi:hypothetical protein